MNVVSVNREIRGEIMRTDVYGEILCTAEERAAAEISLAGTFEEMRSFAERYSRFRRNNELWKLNRSPEYIVSEELFTLLEAALHFFGVTKGLFNPAILPALERTGYPGAYSEYLAHVSPSLDFGLVRLDRHRHTVSKPENLFIDLGGIGKGFIVDKVSHTLASRWEDTLVDAGGDICARGGNRRLHYPYWAIDIENAVHSERALPTLMLRDCAVATSGSTRRHWSVAGERRHHLIDPATGTSVESALASVTVVAKNALSADVWAKTLFLASAEARANFIEEEHLAAGFLYQDGHFVSSPYLEPYVWKSPQ